jgi:SAM-dependent methyltransferase
MRDGTKRAHPASFRRRLLDAALGERIRPLLEARVAVKYIARNLDNRRKTILKSPFVCHFPAFDPECSLRYMDEEVGDYLLHSGLRREDLEGRRVLEVGPGENLGVGLRLLQMGVRKVVSIDRFHSLRPASEQVRLYRAMAENLPPGQRREFDSVIEITDGDYRLDPARYEYHPGTPLETFADDAKFNSGFDLIVSRAVLEHLYDPARALEAMDRLLAPGGRMIHEIDFRDHGMYSSLGLNPLTFLTVPDIIWRAMSSHVGAPNRWLAASFANKLKAMGYGLRMDIKHILHEDRVIGKPALIRGVDFGDPQAEIVEGIRSRLLPRFRRLPLEELLTSVIVITARKSH